MVRWGWLLACLAFAVFASLIPREAQAHPLGNFTINHSSSLEFAEEAARITYVIDFAEIPTLQQKARLDADGDRKLSDRKANAYLDAEIPSLVEGLRLRAGDEVLPLEVLHRSAEYRSGQGGLPTLRVETHLLADLPKDWRGEAHYADKTYANRLGWREIVVRGGPEVAIRNSLSGTLQYRRIVCRTNFATIRETCSPARPMSARRPSRSFLATGRSRTRRRAGRRSASERASVA